MNRQHHRPMEGFPMLPHR